ncbi:hypothetical protein V8C34DRAFT_284200 [Trichoderma compactum]
MNVPRRIPNCAELTLILLVLLSDRRYVKCCGDCPCVLTDADRVCVEERDGIPYIMSPSFSVRHCLCWSINCQ